MEYDQVHEIELYPLDKFRTLLDHEVNRSRRYKQPLTLLHLAVEASPQTPHTQHSAEVFTINALNIQLRDTDIPCREGNEFIVLMPATDELGGQIVCERLEQLFKVTHQTYDRVSFEFSVFMGMTFTGEELTVSSHMLLEQAAAALEHARANRVQHTVLFSNIKK